MFVLDPGRCFIFANRRGAELAGCPASCLVGRTACEIFPEEWSWGFFACAEAALSKKAPGYFRGSTSPSVPGSTQHYIRARRACLLYCGM